MKEADWHSLIKALKANKLIPIIGTGLMQVEAGGRTLTYENYIAEKLAHNYDITDEKLAPLGTCLTEATLNDVVSVCIRDADDRNDVYFDICKIIDESHDEIKSPHALKLLAEIKDFNLFVTSTWDPLLENALRAMGKLLTCVYRTLEEKEDLPLRQERSRDTRYLYYLMGRAEYGSQDFGICDEDLLRFVRKLHENRYRPKELFDELRENNFLLLGINFGDWLARFFLSLAKNPENQSSDRPRILREYLADQKAGHDRSLVWFLQHFSRSTVVCTNEPAGFVEELHRRWSEASPRAVVMESDNRPATEMPPGSFFISYSHADGEAARNLYADLNARGLPVWYDAGLTGTDDWELKLRHNIEACSLFLPLISRSALGSVDRQFRDEWYQAVKRHRRFFGTGKSLVIPIVIDEDDSVLKQRDPVKGMPPEFKEVQMFHCPNGRPSSGLIASLEQQLATRSQGAGGGQ
jgi:hypothetical protein